MIAEYYSVIEKGHVVIEYPTLPQALNYARRNLARYPQAKIFRNIEGVSIEVPCQLEVNYEITNEK